MFIRLLSFSVGLLFSLSVFAGSNYRQIDWLDLLTPADLKAMESLPEIDHTSSPERKPARNKNQTQQFTSNIKNDRVRSKWDKVLNSTTVRQELNGTAIRIAGFLVPLETDGKGNTTEFFLVPYQGACIHMPPPPVNQIIYLKLNKGYAFKPSDIYEGFWVNGILHTELTQHTIARAAYSMTVDTIRLYTP